MTTQILCTKTLPLIRDGVLAIQLDHELAKIYQDCVERPGLKKPRSVTMKIAFVPVGDDPLDGVDVEFTVSPASLPSASIVRQMRSVPRSRGFGFSADTDSVAHLPSQRRLDGVDGDETFEE